MMDENCLFFPLVALTLVFLLINCECKKTGLFRQLNIPYEKSYEIVRSYNGLSDIECNLKCINDNNCEMNTVELSGLTSICHFLRTSGNARTNENNINSFYDFDKSFSQATKERLLDLNPVIEVDIKAVGFDDPVSRPKISIILINGTDYSTHARGMIFVVLNVRTGAHIVSKGFDWYVGYCQEALDFVRSLPKDVIVIAVSQNTAYFNDRTACSESLALIRGTAPYGMTFRSSFVLIGYKGDSIAPSWITQETEERRKGPLYVKRFLRLQNF